MCADLLSAGAILREQAGRTIYELDPEPVPPAASSGLKGEVSQAATPLTRQDLHRIRETNREKAPPPAPQETALLPQREGP